MLPPVPATSVAHAMQANQRQASTQPVEQPAPVPDDATRVTASPVVAGTKSSMELLDLSGQMRLAQSLSVFAETLGSLLKLPRRDGEGLADYSKRLVATINALSATDRARLQTQLNQIMQGATLRLLAELLKDPSGLTAARLAVQIEIAQYREQNQGRDLAARHAVNSYRQNNGNDLPANSNINATAAATPRGAGAETVDHEAGATTTAPVGTDKTMPAAAPRDGAAPTKTTIDAAVRATSPVTQPTNASEALISEQGGSESREDSTSHPAPETDVGTDGDAGQANRSVTDNRPTEEKTARTTAPDTRQQSARDQSGLSPTAPGTEFPSTNRTDPKSAAIYDAAALARQAHGDSGKPLATTTIARALVEGLQADWIAELLADETEARHTQQLPSPRGSHSLAVNGEEIDMPTDVASPANRQVPASVQADEDAPEPVIGPLPQTTNPLSATAMIAAQPDTAFEKALLGMTLLPRDVPGHPLVPQNGTPEFDDEQDHEVRRKSAVGDDEQPPRREHQGFHQPSGGEEQPPDDDEQPAENMLPGDEMAHSDVPDSMPTTSGLRQAPRQHLSDHPAASAEDLYRRLASLE